LDAHSATLRFVAPRSEQIRITVAVALVAGLTCVPHRVLAQESNAEVRALQSEISKDYNDLVKNRGRLSAEGCVTACRALGSMKRATDRLCVLDPGPPCADAKQKTAEAEARVEEACPDCAPQGTKKAEKAGEAVAKPRDQRPATPPATPQREEAREGATAESTPASAPKRGGCAGCATTPSSSPSDALAPLLVGLGLWLRRRARNRNRGRTP